MGSSCVCCLTPLRSRVALKTYTTDVASAAAVPNPSEDNVVRQSTRMKIPSLKRLATEVDVDNETHDSVEGGTQVKRRQARPALTYADLYVGLHVYAKWIVSGGTSKKHGATILRLNPDLSGKDGTADIT